MQTTKMAPTREQASAILQFIMAVAKRNRATRSKKRTWVRSWLQRRETESVYHRLLKELTLEDTEEIRRWILLDKAQYNHLLRLVTPLIEKNDTKMRKAVTAGERLTLRYLATGESQKSLGYQFRISHNLVSSIIPSVCRAIYQELQPIYMRFPATQSEWREVAENYFTQWNFPKCIGALHGKRVLVARPPQSCSEFCNYEGHFSIIMMALVDADYKFMYANVGDSGRASDGGVWERCSLKEGLEGNSLNIPPPSALPFSDKRCPYVIIGDEAFPLKTYLMKPFPGRDLSGDKAIFNYRLSRARRTSENAFGVLAARFQIFKRPICTSPDNVKDIVFATVALHNYLQAHSKKTYSPPELLDREDPHNGRIHLGEWHQHPQNGLERIQAVGRGHSYDASAVRETLLSYFNNEGRVQWQNGMAFLH